MRQKNTVEQQSSLRRLFGSKAFYPIIGALFVLVTFGVVREAVRQYELNRDIKALEDEIAQLETHNNDLNGLISYLHTDTYKERRARESLGFVKPGENVVVVPEKDVIIIDETTGEVLGVAAEDSSNFTKWINYFFETDTL